MLKLIEIHSIYFCFTFPLWCPLVRKLEDCCKCAHIISSNTKCISKGRNNLPRSLKSSGLLSFNVSAELKTTVGMIGRDKQKERSGSIHLKVTLLQCALRGIQKVVCCKESALYCQRTQILIWVVRLPSKRNLVPLTIVQTCFLYF